MKTYDSHNTLGVDDTASQNQIQDDNELQAEINRAKERLLMDFDIYLDILSTKIVKSDAARQDNKQVCVGILNQFYKDIENDYKLLEKRGLIVDDMADAYAKILLEFATCLFWSNEFIEAIKVLEHIKTFLPRTSLLFNDILNLEKRLETSTRSVENQNGEKSKNSVLLIALAIGIIAGCGLTYFALNGSAKKETSVQTKTPAVVSNVNTKATREDFILCFEVPDKGKYYLDSRSVELVSGSSADPVIHYVIEGRKKAGSDSEAIWRADRFYDTRTKTFVDGSNYKGTMKKNGQRDMKVEYQAPFTNLRDYNYKNRIFKPNEIEMAVFNAVQEYMKVNKE